MLTLIMAESFNKEDIINKVNAGKDLTREEELFYLTRVQKFTAEEAERIIAIGENKNPNLIID
jgi:hypothetical protein